MTTSGGLGEAEVGGPSLNIVPKTGGNSVQGQLLCRPASPKGMVGSNYTEELKDRGLTTPGELHKLWDFNVGVGGPIKKDRLWFFCTFRDEGSHRTVPGMFANVNAGDPTKWTYVADHDPAGGARRQSYRIDCAAPDRRRRRRATSSTCSGTSRCRAKARACPGSDASGLPAVGRRRDHLPAATAAPTPPASATAAPETGGVSRLTAQRVRQVTWTVADDQPAAARGRRRHLLEPVGRHADARAVDTADLIRVTEQCARRLRGQRQHRRT